MALATTEHHRGLRILFGLACTVVLVAGLKAAASLLLPLLSAAFLSVLCIPPMRRLQRLGVPQGWSVAIVVAGATVVVFLVTAVIGNSIIGFQDDLPYYRDRLNGLMLSFFDFLQARGLEVSPAQLTTQLDSGQILELVANTAVALMAAASNLFLVVIIMIFILVEANDLPHKLRRALGNPDADLTEYGRGAEQIYKYLAIKTAVSLATGVVAAIACAAFGVSYPLLWGLLAFLFNYVPNIGSIIAAIPPVLLAVIERGVVPAALVATSYLVINMVVGNVLEPRLMGRRLGLSALVVFVSLVFWGWVWGPVGMLLSVPLTVIIKILFEHSEDFRALGVLLGSSVDEATSALEQPLPGDGGG